MLTHKQIQLKKRQAQIPVSNATQSNQSPKFDVTPKSVVSVDYSAFKKSEADREAIKQMKKQCINPGFSNIMKFQF